MQYICNIYCRGCYSMIDRSIERKVVLPKASLIMKLWIRCKSYIIDPLATGWYQHSIDRSNTESKCHILAGIYSAMGNYWCIGSLAAGVVAHLSDQIHTCVIEVCEKHLPREAWIFCVYTYNMHFIYDTRFNIYAKQFSTNLV